MGQANRDHWERVWSELGPAGGSWFEAEPATSLELIDALGLGPSAPIVDIGGGASNLVDHLLLRGFEDVTVVDLSAHALKAARERLGKSAARVRWIEADVLDLVLPEPVDLWHDRAAFHFLVDPSDQATYVRRLQAAVRPGGHLVLATFALDGPPRCSGLEVARHSATTIAGVLGPGFHLLRSVDHEHVTPAGALQRFSYTAWSLSAERT
jgi:SAM-dependent methyltransferase